MPSPGPVENENARSPAPAVEPIAAPANRGQLLLLVGLIATWGWLMQRFGTSDEIYTTLGPFASGVVLVLAALYRRELGRWFLPRRSALLAGMGVGVGMTLLTYPAYGLLRAIAPELDESVALLYSSVHQTPLAVALPWLLTIIAAEELLWRGALLHVLARRVSAPSAMAISVASYGAAQLGTGSWIVTSLALACGTVWTLSRRHTGSLLSPLLAHLIWTPTVILLHPVTSP